METIAVFVTMVAFLPGLVRAGDLEPTDPPGSTMHMLDKIYNKPEQIVAGDWRRLPKQDRPCCMPLKTMGICKKVMFDDLILYFQALGRYVGKFDNG